MASTSTETGLQPAPRDTAVAPEAKSVGSIDFQTQWAFVRDQILYIHINGTEIQIEDCRDNRCDIYYPSWSPGGRYLLYYVQLRGAAPANLIRVAEVDGRIQTLTDRAAYVRPAAWSPSGDTVVYFQATGRYREEESLAGLEEIFEVWIAEIEHEGHFEDAEAPSELLGEIGFGQGCGGGGRSESAILYEREGGFAYGYMAGVMAWSANDVLLYSNNCTSRGVGRFDLTQGQELEPYAELVGSLSMNANHTAWVAVDREGRLVRGTPESMTVALLNNTQRAELVYWGTTSDSYYYTTLETTYTDDLVDAVGQLGDAVWVSPFFDRGKASIRRFVPATGTDELIWSAGDYAYARIYEDANGLLLFSTVEPSDRLYSALQEKRVTSDNWRDFLPSVRVQMLQAGENQPVQVFLSAQSYTAWE